MKNSTKMPTKLSNLVSLVSREEAKKELGEAFASFALNPTVVWAKFILTDDRKNGNGQRIPKTEFANLIRSGIHMPVKMALGEIAPGHDDSKPLGVITHLREMETDGGAAGIVALAALWGEERPADVSFIKERFANQQPVDISWEILYEDELLNEELGSIDLISTYLKAATVVGNPAYQGRTPFLAISAKKAKADEENPNQGNNMEEDTVELEQVKAELTTTKAQLEEANTAKTTAETSLAEAQAEVTRLSEQVTALEAELAPLKEFKDKADAEAAKAQKLGQIKEKFVEAGLEKDEGYFEQNAEKLLALEDSALDFMVQELKAFASMKPAEASTPNKKTEIPPIHETEEGSPSVEDMAKYLRERKGKK